jgi:hypothetical protein
MFVAPDPNTVILGGPGSRLNPYNSWFYPAKQELRKIKIKKIWKESVKKTDV